MLTNIYEIIKQVAILIEIEDIICLAGLVLFGVWLTKTSFGRRALAGSAVRRNNMPFYVPLILLLVWFGSVGIVISIIKESVGDLDGLRSAFLTNVFLCAGSIIITTVAIFLARKYFARRLRGFGLNVRTIGKDFLAAVVNLLAVWPIVMLMIVLTIVVGEVLCGPGFQMQQHEELELLAAHSQLSLRVLIAITTILVIPVFEEILFRGFFQSMIRSFVLSPWISILVTSVFFAIVHSNAGHWPALFVLAMCLGYSYEKSGSLFRPIFIHSLFNAISIVATLNQ